jgi:hypothetical protein
LLLPVGPWCKMPRLPVTRFCLRAEHQIGVSGWARGRAERASRCHSLRPAERSPWFKIYRFGWLHFFYNSVDQLLGGKHEAINCLGSVARYWLLGWKQCRRECCNLLSTRWLSRQLCRSARRHSRANP